jgi:hypothetical protein
MMWPSRRLVSIHWTADLARAHGQEHDHTMKRPFGITILAILFAGVGLTYMMVGLQLTTAVTFGPLPSGQGTWIWGWLIVLGMALLAALPAIGRLVTLHPRVMLASEA